MSKPTEENGADVCETPNSIKNNSPVSGTFAQIPVASAVPAPNIAIRIRHGDTVVEVSSDTPCYLRLTTFRSSISTAENVISAGGLMVWRL